MIMWPPALPDVSRQRPLTSYTVRPVGRWAPPMLVQRVPPIPIGHFLQRPDETTCDLG